MTDNENRARLERKLETYKYLFTQGNESPTERQVELWIDYDDGRLREDQEKKEKYVEEKVQQKITLLQNVGLYSRAKVLVDHLTNFRVTNKMPLLTGIDKYIKQMEIRAREYLPDLLRSRDALLLDIIIRNYLPTNSASKNEEVLEATKSLRQLLHIKHTEHLGRFSGLNHGHNQLQDFRGLLGEDITEVLFDIEQLAHLGINNGTYGVEFSRESYKTAMGNIRQKRTEREKEGKTFDRVVFMTNKPRNHSDDWSNYLVAEMNAEVPYKALFIYNSGDKPIRDRRNDIAEVLGGGQIAIGEKEVLTRSYKRVTGYELSFYPAKRILQQYFGNSKTIEVW